MVPCESLQCRISLIGNFVNYHGSLKRAHLTLGHRQSSWWHQTHTCTASFSLDKDVGIFWRSLNRFEYTSLICAIHMKRHHLQVIHRLDMYKCIRHSAVQLYNFFALKVVFFWGGGCYSDTNECTDKVLKYYLKRSRHLVPTNRDWVALWRSFKWLLLYCLRSKHFHALSNENEVECRWEFWIRVM